MKSIVLFAYCFLVGDWSVEARSPSCVDSKKEGGMAKVSFVGNQVWKTTLDDANKIKILRDLQRKNYLSIWGSHRKTNADLMVESEYLGQVGQKLLENNITYEVSIADLQEAIDRQNPPNTKKDGDKTKLDWSAYYPLDVIYDFLDDLQSNHPELCSVSSIGESVEGRPIKMIKISNGNGDNRAIFIDGGIHAREWISPATVTYLINDLVKKNQLESIRNIDWYIVPVLNPDGYEYTYTSNRLWRKNRGGSDNWKCCVGTDLNRNFGFHWDGGSGASDDPCSYTYRGESAFSEPESRAVRDFFDSNNSTRFTAFVSVHSYGQYIVYPWGYDYAVPEDSQDLDDVAKKTATRIEYTGGVPYVFGPIANTIYAATGSTTDFARGSLNIKYAYTIELRDRGRYGFLLPASYIPETAKEATAGIKVIAEAASFISI